MNVVIYLFRGMYRGKEEYEYNHPELGDTHDCILFLAQNDKDGQYEKAMAECTKFGFAEVVFNKYAALDVEVLNTNQYRGFTIFYEEALQNGSALVYYPNS